MYGFFSLSEFDERNLAIFFFELFHNLSQTSSMIRIAKRRDRPLKIFLQIKNVKLFMKLYKID